MLQRIVDHVLDGDDRLLVWHLHRRGRNHIGLGQNRIFDAAAERVLHEQLLQLKIVLRHNQILLIRGDRTLRAHHLNRRHRPDLRLALAVVQSLLRVGQRLLLHADVFVSEDQIPVHVLNLVDGGDYLQAESNVGNLAVIFGDANESSVGQRAKSLQQVLRDPKLKVRSELGSEQADGAVGGQVIIVKARGESGAPMKALRVGKVGSVGVLSDDSARRRAENAHRFGIVLVELQRAGELGIEADDRRSYAERRVDQAIGAGAGAACRDRGAARAGADVTAEPANAAAGSVLHDAGVDAENAGAGSGSQQIRFGDVQVVAGDVEVEIVLQRERDGVVDGEINLAVAHERVDAWRVSQIRRRQLLRFVRQQYVGKRRARLGIILQEDGLGSRRLRRGGRRYLRHRGGRDVLRQQRSG